MTKKLMLKFDFIAHKHCSDPNANIKCNSTVDKTLVVDEDITRVGSRTKILWFERRGFTNNSTSLTR